MLTSPPEIGGVVESCSTWRQKNDIRKCHLWRRSDSNQRLGKFQCFFSLTHLAGGEMDSRWRVREHRMIFRGCRLIMVSFLILDNKKYCVILMFDQSILPCILPKDHCHYFNGVWVKGIGPESNRQHISIYILARTIYQKPSTRQGLA